MEKFLLIFCVILSPSITQGLPTKHKGSDLLIKKVIDRLIQQHGIGDHKRNLYTAITEEINNSGDNGGKNVFINGIKSFIQTKRLGHAGSGIVKRSSSDLDDLHARGTSTTPKPPTTPSESPTPSVTTSSATTPATSSQVTTTPATTTPVTTTPIPTVPRSTTTEAYTTTGFIIEYPQDDLCVLFECSNLIGDYGLFKDYYLF